MSRSDDLRGKIVLNDLIYYLVTDDLEEKTEVTNDVISVITNNIHYVITNNVIYVIKDFKNNID